jgi:hypothetical protein
MSQIIRASIAATRRLVWPGRARPLGLSAALLLGLMTPGVTWSCACGCGVFDVGTGAMFPEGAGGILFIQSDFMDQNKNWSGTSQAPADDNGDKRIRTQFNTIAAQYMLNRSWGLQIDVPYWNRKFTAIDEDTGDIVTFNHSATGDVRIRGIYTGFSPDLSTGITFGLKLSNGDSSYANFDPDTEIGSGSTDILLGAYHQGRISSDNRWSYFARGMLEQPVRHKAAYRPGNELTGVAGVYYDVPTTGSKFKVTPLVQLTVAYRGHDSGPMGEPENTGYKRVIVAPGVELHVSRVSIYLEAGFAVYNDMTGDQLVAKKLYKVSVSVGL